MTTTPTLPKTLVTIAAFVVSAGLLSCTSTQPQTPPPQVETSTPRTLFSETTGILPSDERARRKWDGAMVGDLDGDGHQDLILTEHAHQVHIYWNEGGRFSEPQTLITGDMHGTGIADFDGNGLVEIVVAQSGGNGSNPRKPIHFEVYSDRTINTGEVLSHFEKGRGRSIKAFDANQNGDLDIVTANERGRWRLFENHSNSRNANHFIGVTVNDAPSGNATKLGAKATVNACGNAWERRVGDTSSAYAVAFNNDLLFGLGACENVDKIIVEWTNGELLDITPNVINQYVSTSEQG